MRNMSTARKTSSAFSRVCKSESSWPASTKNGLCWRSRATSMSGDRRPWPLLTWSIVISFPSADAIYNLGIARKAQPAERLRKRREAFQARMMLPRPPSLVDSIPASSETRSVRPTLGKSSGSSTTFRGTALSAASARSALPNNGAAGFAVFQDGTDENGQSQGGNAQDGWEDFGTNSSRRRENERAATAWKGETLPMQAASLSASQGPRLEVFRDEVRKL